MDDRIDELYASVVDTGRRTPRSGGGSSSGRGRVAVALVAVLAVCAMVGWLVLRPGSTGSSSSGGSETEGVEQSDVWAADSTPGVIDDLVEVVGGTEFVRISLSADHVSAVAPTTPGATTTDRFSWRDGKATRDGPEGRLADDEQFDGDCLFDVRTVDWTAVEGLVVQMSDVSGINGRPSSVDVRRAVKGGASAAAEFSLSMHDDYGRGASITADEKGQVVWMRGDIEGSPAFEWEAAGLYQTGQIQRVIADLVSVAGGPQFVEVRIDSWSASAAAPVVPGDSKVGGFRWYNGFAAVNARSLSDLDPAALFDVTTVDWTLLEGLVAQARDLTGVAHPKSWVSVERPRSQGGYSDVVFNVGVYDGSDGSEDGGSVVFDMAGQIVSMKGGVPGSASQEWEATH